MTVAVIARQQTFERVQEVVIGPRAGLDDRDTGGGVRYEHVAQSIVMSAAKRPQGVGEVDYAAAGGVDIEYVGVHTIETTSDQLD
jgi:hypothetical protein